ncbi:MAG: hypothetical protein ABI682_11825 [Acidobacteriota bacterium]
MPSSSSPFHRPMDWYWPAYWRARPVVPIGRFAPALYRMVAGALKPFEFE